MNVVFLLCVGVALKVMSMFSCRNIDGQYWLVADMRLRCYDAEWTRYAASAQRSRMTRARARLPSRSCGVFCDLRQIRDVRACRCGRVHRGPAPCRVFHPLPSSAQAAR